MNVLHIDSSISGETSVSRHLSAAIVAQLLSRHPEAQIVYRDLAADPIEHLDGRQNALLRARPDADTSVPQAARNRAILDEFMAAGVIVIGAPMYNFAVPSQLKAWLDRIAVAGETFRYTERGPQGLAGGRKVIIVSIHGGFFRPGSAIARLEHQESYLVGFFEFLGIDDIAVVRAEGVARGPDERRQGIAAAEAEIARLQL